MVEIGKLQRKYKNEKEKKVGFVLCVMVVQKCMGSLKSERVDITVVYNPPSNFHLFIYGFVLLFPLPQLITDASTINRICLKVNDVLPINPVHVCKLDGGDNQLDFLKNYNGRGAESPWPINVTIFFY